MPYTPRSLKPLTVLAFLCSFTPLSLPGAIIIDNSDPQYTESGPGWSDMTSDYAVDALARKVDRGTGESTARWTPDLPVAGTYDVYGWWVSGGSFFRSQAVPLTINHQNGIDTMTVSQSSFGGKWYYLGRYDFAAGTGGYVELSNDVPETRSSIDVIADAVRFEKVEYFTDTIPTTAVSAPRGEACSNCAGTILYGAHESRTDAKYFIHSDVPEKFGTEGILYSTKTMIPEQSPGFPQAPFNEQENNGFNGIDDNFEVFVFHISQPGDLTAPRRLVIYAENIGENDVTISPRQTIITDGIIGTVHQMESNLGRRFMDNDYDDFGIPSSVTIPAGQGAAIGFSKKFATFSGQYRSQNINCFGLLHADVEGNDPLLEVSVVAIDTSSSDTPPNLNTINSNTQALIIANQGALELEDLFDLDTYPTTCELRRSAGVFPNMTWRNELVDIDVNVLQDRRSYLMALDTVRTNGCEDLDQSVHAYLAPRFLHPYSIGNYHYEYRLQFHVYNSGQTPLPFDLEFGKSDADIGLVYELASSTTDVPSDETVDSQPATTVWAGPKQDLTMKSILPGGEIIIEPGEEIFYALHFQILGNSSLPFMFQIPDNRPPVFERLRATPGYGRQGDQVQLKFLSSEILNSNPLVTVNQHPATYSSRQQNNYTFNYTILNSDPTGHAIIEMTGTDYETNQGVSTDTDALTIGSSQPADTWLFLGE